jgi:hypothetical protein
VVTDFSLNEGLTCLDKDEGFGKESLKRLNWMN